MIKLASLVLSFNFKRLITSYTVIEKSWYMFCFAHTETEAEEITWNFECISSSVEYTECKKSEKSESTLYLVTEKPMENARTLRTHRGLILLGHPTWWVLCNAAIIGIKYKLIYAKKKKKKRENARKYLMYYLENKIIF